MGNLKLITNAEQIMQLTILNQIPKGLLDKPAEQLYQTLPNPTLIHLSGNNSKPLFISVLLHGNETTGWDAIRLLLKQYQHKNLPRSISLFIGNIRAAKENKRVLEYQMDYNRAWNVSEEQIELNPEQKIMQQVLKEMKKFSLFASIDLHNNTGLNPHYACINKKDDRFYQLALLFSQTVVYFIKPDAVQSMAFSKLCPSVTLECGQPGEANGVKHVLEYLQKVMILDKLSNQQVPPDSMNLYHTMAIVKLPENISFSFKNNSAQINFHKNLESYNFKAIEAETIWAEINEKEAKLLVIDEKGDNVFDQYFKIRKNHLLNTKPFMPAMITLNQEIIRQDCMCYIMEQL
jgi:succinylglutamate desuccinylase